MATISSHVLDSVIGDHAGGLQVQCYLIRSPTDRSLLFDVVASAEGRIAEEIDVPDASSVELVFQSAEYFAGRDAARADRAGKDEAKNSVAETGVQIMPQVVVRLTLPDAALKYHVPIMLSPHSYSMWWSGI